MALPTGIRTTQITFGTAVTMISAKNLTMRVTFTPTTSLIWAATGTVLIADAEGITADPGSQGTVTLINPDQAGFTDGTGNTIRNFGYKVEATYSDGNSTLLTAPAKYITWTADDTGPLDLDQMIPVTASSGITVAMPIVTSVNGQTGAVTTGAPPVTQRRRELPGTAGLLTAYTGTAPTVTLSAANVPSAIPNGQYPTYPQTQTLPAVGANLTVLPADPAAYYPATVTPTDGNSFQPYRFGYVTDSQTTEFQFRGVGSQYRIWVDGRPTSLTPSTLPGGGAFYRLTITFATRVLRRLEVEIDTGHLSEVVLDAGATILPAAPTPTGIRGLIMGDSYTEGTGATARFTNFATTFGQLAGWGETISSGSGGTGYLNPGVQTGRVKFRDRFATDVAALNPDVIIFTGGRNDNGYATAAAVQTEAAALYALAKATLPRTVCYVTSAFPATATEAADTALNTLSNGLKTAATAAGFPFLDVMGANAYITGTGRVGATTGTGNADTLTGPDGVHPSQAGHDTLARVLFHRYAATLTG